MQIQLTGFLEKDTPKFCKALWNLLLSAQANSQGVPKELLEAKKKELLEEKVRPIASYRTKADRSRYTLTARPGLRDDVEMTRITGIGRSVP